MLSTSIQNFHSILRSQSQESDTFDMLCQKAKATDNNKGSSMSFQSAFVVPKQFTSKRGRLERLKLSAAEFLCSVLQDIKDHPNNGSMTAKPRGKAKNTSYWKLPQLNGEETVSSRVLPLGFQFPGKEPNTHKFVLQEIYIYDRSIKFSKFLIK